MICLSWRAIARLLALLVLLLLGVALTAGWWLPAIGHWLMAPVEERPADAIVVLSGGGRIRINHGIDLYHAGLATRLWYTGDSPTSAETADAPFARQLSLQRGVPDGAITLLATTSTWEDGQQIARLVGQQKEQRLLVVTHWYHSRRALCVVRHHLPTGVTVYYSAPPTTVSADNWWQNEEGLVTVVNEFIKMGFYWWHYGLAPWRC